MESGEIEWFEYKFCFKEAAFYMLAISFQQIDNRFWRDKCEKSNWAVSHMVLIHKT